MLKNIFHQRIPLILVLISQMIQRYFIDGKINSCKILRRCRYRKLTKTTVNSF